MAYLLQLLGDLSGQSVVVWSSILDPAICAMSRQDLRWTSDEEKAMCLESILLRVKVYKVNTKLTRGSCSDGATGDTYSGLDITQGTNKLRH